MNLPNALTLSRIFVVPLLVVVLLTKFPSDFVPDTSAGQTNSMTFTAPSPGTYQFVCTIHTAQGMTGTLVVLPQ